MREMLTGEEAAITSVVNHVVNMRERLTTVTQVGKDNLEIKKPKVKEWYDKRSCDRKLNVGDQVLI